MPSQRYLTKSRYQLGLECPAKLYYTGKPEYHSTKMDDPFMQALAQGGYQVGELAKHYFPGGHDVSSLDYAEAERQTQALLQQENVVIYEPAILFNNLFIRIDILVKTCDQFELIEVKAKSIDTRNSSPFIGKRGGLLAGWKDYLFDVAFQSYVLQSAYPQARIKNFLMLADKRAVCATDGLNQKFKIERAGNRKGVSVSANLCAADLAVPILVRVPVDQEIGLVQKTVAENGKTFVEQITFLATAYERDEKITPIVGLQCKTCEFKCTPAQEEEGLLSGYKSCWQHALQWRDEDFAAPHVFDLWSCRSVGKFMQQGKLKLADLTEDDLKVCDDNKPGLSPSQRQWLQVEMAVRGDAQPYLDTDGMRDEMAKWVFPLHFIDFETVTVALPFTCGRRPYEEMAFQFSHHKVYADGRVEHAGQYLNTERGVFPNFDFVRALKLALECDSGTVFCYASHENTYLNAIFRQIDELQGREDALPDAEALQEFIRDITHSGNGVKPGWTGRRDMVDMLELVKRYFYHLAMRGSNSLKVVLPAILNSSPYLQEKYSQPIYGASNGAAGSKCDAIIPSLNFVNQQWVQLENGEVIDPYKKLPRLFGDVGAEELELMLSDEAELANGGAAMTAYAKIQFEAMSDYEREELERGLLKYCELDTLAMVMLYEGWREMCNNP